MIYAQSMVDMERRRSTQIATRFEPETCGLIRRVAEARGEDVSDFVRRAVKSELARLSFSTQFEKKSLGIEEGGENHG